MIKSYIYISQSKVDMLLGQVPPVTKEKIAGELGVNLGILSVKIKSQLEQDTSMAGGDSDVSRLLAAERFVEAEGNVTTIGAPGEWVRGSLDVRHVALEGSTSIFMLVGKSGDTIVMLTGSASHVVGTATPETVNIGASYLPFLVTNLAESLQKLDSRNDDFLRLRSTYGRNMVAPALSEHELASTIFNLYQYSKSFAFHVEFLGRQLFSNKRDDGLTCSIISPLYVCNIGSAG